MVLTLVAFCVHVGWGGQTLSGLQVTWPTPFLSHWPQKTTTPRLLLWIKEEDIFGLLSFVKPNLM